MTAMKLENVATPAENKGGNNTIIVLNTSTCKGCEGEFTCEQAYRNCKACVTMPELFVSQR